MYNLNLFFNKLYYQNLGSDAFGRDLERKNRILFGALFSENDYDHSPLAACEEQLGGTADVPSAYPGYTCFCMETVYPGLLIGTGYSHGSGEADEDIKLGFSFDYTTGQPYIPGSTVKGVLKSAFAHPELIGAVVLSSEISSDDKEAKKLLIKALEEDIFESNRDVFLDAVVFRGDQNGKLLGQDYITPHGEIIKNPKPLQFLKILPNVCLEFRFILTDSVVKTDKSELSLKAEDKRKLFIYLLEIFGIGAKTNVGYGALKEVERDSNRCFPNNDSVNEWTQRAVRSASETSPQENNASDQTVRTPAREDRRENRPPTREAQQARPVKENADVKTGDIVTGIVTNIMSFGAFVRLTGTGKTGLIHISEITGDYIKNVEDHLHVNDKVQVKVISIEYCPNERIGLSLRQVNQT